MPGSTTTTVFLLRYGHVAADGLTLLRVLLSLGLVLLGLRGKAALSTVVCVTVLAWFTDLVDGRLASRSNDPQRRSWFGRHDAEADLSVALGVSAYLTLSGYLATWLGLSLIAAAIALRLSSSYNLPWLVIPIPYATLLVLAFRDISFWGYLMLGYLLIPLAIGHRRLRGQYLREFFADVQRILGTRKDLDQDF